MCLETAELKEKSLFKEFFFISFTFMFKINYLFIFVSYNFMRG